MVSFRWRMGAFAASFPVRTRSTPSAMAWATVSHFRARATPRPRTERAVAVQFVPTMPRTGGDAGADTPPHPAPTPPPPKTPLRAPPARAPPPATPTRSATLGTRARGRGPAGTTAAPPPCVAPGLHAPPRVLHGRDPEVATAAMRDETGDLEVLVRLGPPVPVDDPIAR